MPDRQIAACASSQGGHEWRSQLNRQLPAAAAAMLLASILCTAGICGSVRSTNGSACLWGRLA